MKHTIKLFVVLTVVSLLGLMLAGVASAEVVQGQGWLHARGAGVVVLRMSGDVEITGHGVGAVYVYGAEDIYAAGQGRRTDLPGGGVIFRGYRGKITISGEEMMVRMAGGKIDFVAEGEGRALLRGQGHYETRHGSGDWSAEGTTVESAAE
jgi:hypothetical protein